LLLAALANGGAHLDLSHALAGIVEAKSWAEFTNIQSLNQITTQVLTALISAFISSVFLV